MSGVVRLLLIWFIAAAVPLKGLAAVTMVGCGPGHHSPRASVDALPHETHAASHEVREAVGSGVSGSAVEAVDEVPPAASELSTGQSTQLKMKCSSCAPCCSVVAPALERVGISTTASASTAVVFLETRFPAVFVNGTVSENIIVLYFV